MRLHVSAEHRTTAAADGVFPLRKLAMILRICSANVTDGAHAESKEVRFGVCCISLKVTMKATVVTRSDQRIVRPSEVVHADVLVSRSRQPFDGIDEELEFLHFGR